MVAIDAARVDLAAVAEDVAPPAEDITQKIEPQN
jgi:hypothetical protein